MNPLSDWKNYIPSLTEIKSEGGDTWGGCEFKVLSGYADRNIR